ncbi:MAG: 3-dehydroquinate synthase [Chloroflexi bacterium]|nr:3-dehydroquinate synthase [Chloroflexota bacterium]
MAKEAPRNIIITGFSFTGKSRIGQEVARRLGWGFVDSDHQIVALAGKGIPEIFAQDGEQRFRELERQVLEEVCARESFVIAAGGGAVVDPRNRELFPKSGVVICLEAKPQTIHRRLLRAQKGNSVVRPLLAAGDPLKRIEELKMSRQHYYALADWTVHTDSLTLDEVCDEVMHGWKRLSERRIKGRQITHWEGAACVVTTATASYPVFVGRGLLDELGKRMRQAGLGDFVYIISDEDVYLHYGGRAIKSLEEAGFTTEFFLVIPGEGTKTIDTAKEIYDWLVERRAERGHAIVALGGGVVGDLAGFVAATFLRGLPLVQVPTTLVAMADSAIGGKVAVNHPQGKNLIGAFYQPRLVVADVSTLSTLPQRELASGWAEVIKHALILDPELLEFLEVNAERLVNLEMEATTEAVKRSAALKAGVVREDEKERGRRMILNYGHTIAHGLEAATGYERFLHGEAVAIGMMGAAMLSEKLGLFPRDIVKRQEEIIQRFGLPTTCSEVDRAEVLRAMELDKKVREGTVRWVLLAGVGKPVLRDDVPVKHVVSVLEELIS